MDGIVEWADAQRRVIDLVGGLDAQAERRVPACPDWSVRDLFSPWSVSGSMLAGDEPDDHNATWTQRQVDERRGRDLATLVAEWQDVTEPMQAYMRERGTRPLGDLVIHEQDLRGALGVSGAQDTCGLAVIRDRMLRRFAPRVAGLPPIALMGDGWRWTSGDGDPAVVVRAPDFELARALMARGSARQIRAWTVSGDVEPYLPAFATLGRSRTATSGSRLHPSASRSSIRVTLASSSPVNPGRMSALSTRLTRGLAAATASTAPLTTPMTSSHSPRAS